MGVLLGATTLLLLAGTALLLASTLGIRSAAELLLAMYVIGFAEVVALFLFLSAFNSVTRASLVAGVAFFFVAAVAVWTLAGAKRFPLAVPRRFPAVQPGVLLVLAVGAGLALAYVTALIVGTPPNGWDPLNYHLARAAFWTQHHGIGYIGNAYDERLNFNPPDAEIAMSFLLDVTREEHAAGFVQLGAALTCGVGVVALARRLGLSAREALFGALVFLTLPLVVLQASGAKNDLIVASVLVAAAVFLLGQTRRDLVLAALATALAVGTKFTAAYGLVLLLAIALLGLPRGRRAAAVAAVAIGGLAGGYWYGVNAVETGHLLGDQSNVPGLTAPLQPRENVLTAYGASVDTLDVSGVEGADAALFGIAAVVGLAALTLAARWGRRPALVLASIVASPLLMLLLSGEVGRPGLVWLYDALGKPDGFVPAGEEPTSSATFASDTASWFGPAGFLLVAGTAVAVVLLIRRRQLPNVAYVFALAPLAWFALVALSLTYNPWLGRFFVFPVAVSAVLWGLVLRIRAAAWGIALVALITVSLSLVHYAEKPAGIDLLERTHAQSVWRLARWQVQSQHAPEIAPVLRFLDEEVPDQASVALALGANDFGYPVFGPHLRRRVVLVPFASPARDVRTDWLVASVERMDEIDQQCWHAAVRSPGGAVFRRAACPGST